jgi:hypothetical protein
MNVYIPVATGTVLSRLVRASIEGQTVACNIVMCPTEPVPGNRRLSEANSRNYARALVTDDDMYLMQDHNALLLCKDIYERLIYTLWHDSHYDVVVANKGRPGSQDHPDQGVMACRGCVAEVPFAATDSETCLCLRYKADLEKAGYSIGYMDQDIHYRKEYHA